MQPHQRNFTPSGHFQAQQYIPPPSLASHQTIAQNRATAINNPQNSNSSTRQQRNNNNNLQLNRQMLERQYQQQQQQKQLQQLQQQQQGAQGQKARDHSFENKENYAYLHSQQAPKMPPSPNSSNNSSYIPLPNHSSYNSQGHMGYAKEYHYHSQQPIQLPQQPTQQQQQTQQIQFFSSPSQPQQSPQSQQSQSNLTQQRQRETPQQQQANSSFNSRISTEQIQSYIQDQMEEFKIEFSKNLNEAIQDCITKSQSAITQIEVLKRQVGSNRLDISEVNQRIEDVTVALEESRGMNSHVVETTINEEFLSNEIQRALKMEYGQRLEAVEQGQLEVKNTFELLKGEVIKEISSQMSSVGNEIASKVQEEDEVIYENIAETKRQSDKKLQTVFEQVSARIAELERNSEEIKIQNVVSMVEQFQNSMVEKFNDYIKLFDQDLEQMKVQLDNKFNISDLEEILNGQRQENQNQLQTKFQREFKQVQDMLEEKSFYQNQQEEDNQKRQKKLEENVELKMKEYQSRLREKFDLFQQVDVRVGQQDYLIDEIMKNMQDVNQKADSINSQIQQAQQSQREEINQLLDLSKREMHLKLDSIAQQNKKLEQNIQQVEQMIAFIQNQREQDKELESSFKNNSIQSNQLEVNNLQEISISIQTQQKQLLQTQQLQSSTLSQLEDRINKLTTNSIDHIKIQQYDSSSLSPIKQNIISQQQQPISQIYQQNQQIQQLSQQQQEQQQSNQNQLSQFKFLQNQPSFQYEPNTQLLNEQISSFNNSLSSKIGALLIQNNEKVQETNPYLEKESNSLQSESSHARESSVSTKYDEYLQKYNDFSKQVNNYISSSEIQPNSCKKYCFQIRQQLLPLLEKDLNFEINSITKQKTQDLIPIYECRVDGKQTEDQKNLIIKEKPDEEEIVYELDDKGYLIDDRGNYILDDEGKAIQLSPEHIEYLKSNNILSDDSVAKHYDIKISSSLLGNQ